VTADPLPTVVPQEVMLTQLFQNLIGNSIKYRGEAAPTIHISAERSAQGWLFSLKDSGIGIDPADSERVFGMFKRLHGKDSLVQALGSRFAGRWLNVTADAFGWHQRRGGVRLSNSRFPRSGRSGRSRNTAGAPD
jgi:hypothetical protein